MSVDPWLSRLVTGAVCFYGLILVGTAAWQALSGYESDGNIKELAYLIVGGLLSQVTIHGRSKDGTQEVSVPDPLPAPPLTPADPDL